MKILKFALFLLTFLLFSGALLGQCTVHGADLTGIPGASRPANTTIGQTFLACMDGNVTAIDIGFEIGTQAGVYELYLAVEPGSGNSIPETPVATFNLGADLVARQIFTFSLSTPFPVSNDGTVYRLAFKNPSGASEVVLADAGGDYADGSYVRRNNLYSYNTSFDFDFGVHITTNAVLSTAVPTVSEWGMIIIALMLLSIGTLFAMQPQLQMASGKSRSVQIPSLGIWLIPFNKGLFVKIWLGLLVTSMILLLVSILLFAYEVTTADAPMGLLASGLLAFLGQLLIADE